MFDLLFESLVNEIDDPTDPVPAYPPLNDSTYMTLYNAIIRSDATALNKSKLLYYLAIVEDNNRACRHLQALLPQGARHEIEGYIALDRLDAKTAVAHLCYPSVASSFKTRILVALDICSASSSAILTFIRSKHPALDIPELLSIYLKALADVSVYAAVDYIRCCNPADRSSLLSTLVFLLLEGNRLHDLIRLINMELSADEYSVLKAIPDEGLRPLLTMRDSYIS
ncbi:hypothetical protein CANCADRAFT_3871 [Tortispora caseinolytica NRRL Y-17796]|uniref:ELYS-like domain-containing protein n=1 Tax=Tortispora caseinolytica NRRL Y-17796 TaxID=767744 RepID=A0A1E4TBW8_9ASCO|nr:hypothetical protein CANCADRAFT_3871 [Tortispora caseinolytica NRRL Y-17796]